jgi:2-oxoglutarate ferredoxin oxidoreductase subunit beta
LVPLLKAAIGYRGFAFIDVVSPCVTFNNHHSSTKSYEYIRDHNTAVDRLDFIPPREDIEVQYSEGETAFVTMHDGSQIALHKVDKNYDPTKPIEAMAALRRRREAGEVVTGLLYVDKNQRDLHDVFKTPATPLNALDVAALCPGNATLQTINDELR